MKNIILAVSILLGLSQASAVEFQAIEQLRSIQSQLDQLRAIQNQLDQLKTLPGQIDNVIWLLSQGPQVFVQCTFETISLGTFTGNGQDEVAALGAAKKHCLHAAEQKRQQGDNKNADYTEFCRNMQSYWRYVGTSDKKYTCVQVTR